jgi:hypothetical protein
MILWFPRGFDQLVDNMVGRADIRLPIPRSMMSWPARRASILI